MNCLMLYPFSEIFPFILCFIINLPRFIVFQFYCNTVDDFRMASTMTSVKSQHFPHRNHPSPSHHCAPQDGNVGVANLNVASSGGSFAECTGAHFENSAPGDAEIFRRIRRSF